MSIAYKGSGVASVTYKGTDIKRIKKDGNYIWAKSVSLICTKTTNVKSFAYTRVNTSEPSVGTTLQTDGTYLDNTVVYTNSIVGNTVYLYAYDQLHLTGTANTGYRFVSPRYNDTILMNATFEVDNVVAFSKPSIVSSSLNRYASGYTLTITITNPNSVSATAHLSTVLGSAYTETFTVGAGATVTHSQTINSTTAYTSATSSIYFSLGEDISNTTSVTTLLPYLESPIIIQTSCTWTGSTVLIYNPNSVSVTCSYYLQAEGVVNDTPQSSTSNTYETTIGAFTTVQVSVNLRDLDLTHRVFYATLSNEYYRNSSGRDAVNTENSVTMTPPAVVWDGNNEVFGFDITNNNSFEVKFIAVSNYGGFDGSGNCGTIPSGGVSYTVFDYSGELFQGVVTVWFANTSTSDYNKNSSTSVTVG